MKNKRKAKNKTNIVKASKKDSNNPRVLYEKVGGRYKPVRYGVEFDYFPEGYHLIHVDSVGQSWLLNVDPAKVRLKAFVRESLHQRVVEAVKAASELRIRKDVPLTKKQMQAFEDFKRVMGDKAVYTYYSSQREIADMICNEMENWVHENEKRNRGIVK